MPRPLRFVYEGALGQYLAWLNEDEPQQKAYLFERMSKGWAHGSKEFKKGLIGDGEKERQHLQIGGTGSGEALELFWEESVSQPLVVGEACNGG